jgi:hypothetical protein
VNTIEVADGKPEHLGKRQRTMPNQAHIKAEHHESAAKSHRSAAEHHGKNDHTKGNEHSAEAQKHSKIAGEHSEQAHEKSTSRKYALRGRGSARSQFHSISCVRLEHYRHSKIALKTF